MVPFPGKASFIPTLRAAAELFKEFFINNALIAIRFVFKS